MSHRITRRTFDFVYHVCLRGRWFTYHDLSVDNDMGQSRRRAEGTFPCADRLVLAIVNPL